MQRPGLILWLRYAFGAGVPSEYSPWVLHDTTCPSWVARHLARVLVMIAVPLAVVIIWLPTDIGLRGLTAFTTGACVLLLTGILSNDMTERRLTKAGYPWGTGETTRSRRAENAQRVANQRRRDRSAARRARRAA